MDDKLGVPHLWKPPNGRFLKSTRKIKKSRVSVKKDGSSLSPTKFNRALVGYELGSFTAWVVVQGKLSTN